MTSPEDAIRVRLQALGVDVAVTFRGASASEVDSFLRGWSRCRAERGLGAPGAVEVAALVVLPGDPHSITDRARPGDPPTVVAADFRAAADQLSGLITRTVIERRQHDLLMLHAGAVSDPQAGRVLAFIGPSGRGKTTASIALSSVFGYITDETVGVHDDLGVVAYPKPLSVKLPAPEQWKNQVSPDDLGLGVAEGLLPLAGLVMLDRRPSGPPSIRSVELAEVAEELVPQISYLASRPASLRRLQAVIDACGGLKQIGYSEAADLVPVFRELFAAAKGVAAEPRYFVACDDVLGRGDGMLALAGGQVRVFSGIAPTLLSSAVALPRTLSELVDAVVQEHGEAPAGGADSRTAVARVVETLLRSGVLARVGA